MKKKQYDDEFKAKVVARMEKEPVREICRELKLHPSMIYQWRKNAAPPTEAAQYKKDTKAQYGQKDVIIYLKHAERAMNEELREGKVKKLLSSQLYAMLALNAALGG